MNMEDENLSEHINHLVQSAVAHMNNVILPMQKFVYSSMQPPMKAVSRRDFQYSEFEFDTITLDNDEIKKTRGQAKYFVEDLGNGILIEMVYIPSGKFLMGAPDDEEDRSVCESLQHQVSVPAFHIGKFEVAQAQWEFVMQHNLSYNRGSNLPVENVSWQDAVEFCRRLSLITGRTYRLPSEAEWEYACRAGTTTPFSFGTTINTQLANYWDHNEDVLEENSQTASAGCFAAYSPDSVKYLQTKPVGSYFPNAFGLYDMHGNVFELCQDTWHNNYDGAPIDAGAWGSGEDTGSVVIRGGSFDYYDYQCRSAHRSETKANYRYHGTGFRVVCSVE